MVTLICRTCHREFPEKPLGSRGYRNQCLSCSDAQEEPEKTGGNMIWEHKTGPYIELKPISKAKTFARRTRRLGGVGVTASITEPKEPLFSEK